MGKHLIDDFSIPGVRLKIEPLNWNIPSDTTNDLSNGIVLEDSGYVLMEDTFILLLE